MNVETKAAIDELEHLARKVLDLKNESIPRRPIVIEFCGSPKSGKSSCINSLDLFLRRNSFRTKILVERASVCPVRDKYDPNFNIWTVCSAVAELVEVLSNHPKEYDVVILDRGIFDALCWFNWLHDSEKLDTPDFKKLEQFLLMDKWKSVIDLVYVFTATSKVSLEREFANLLTRKTGSIMQPKFLEEYKEVLLRTAKTYRESFRVIEPYDTTEGELNDVNYNVTKRTLEIIQEKIVEKICYVELSDSFDNLPLSFKYIRSPLEATELQYGMRDEVESNQHYLQPIPIAVITNKQRDRILVAKKNKKNTSANSAEFNRLLVYFGGHMREEDGLGTGASKLLSIARRSLQREIKEELEISYVPPITQSNPMCIWTRDNERSRVHIAIVFIMEVDFETQKLRLDQNEFMTQTNTISGSVFTLPEISKRDEELESWSKIILKECFSLDLSTSKSLLN